MSAESSNVQSPSDDEVPAVIVEAAPRYLIGLPMIVALTFENRSKDTEFYGMPEPGLTSVRGGIGLRLEPVAGGPPVTARSGRPEEGEDGATLLPGEQRREAVDLSNFGIAVQPGVYRLSMELFRSRKSRRSDPVTVELVRPSDADAAEAARLRRMGSAPTDTGAWAPFLERNWNTVAPSAGLGAEAARQVALHLFLHRAYYGPDPVARLDPAPLAGMAGDAWLAAEAGALRYEILAARHDPGARKLRDDLLATWPGLKHRLDRVDAGQGAIAFGRKWIGAEKQHLKPPATRPYVP